MNAAAVSRTLALIPDRVPRALSGSTFDPQAHGTCAHPERIAHLAQFLTWLGPLNPVSKDDLRILGFMTPYGKPAILGAEDDDLEPAPLADEPPVALEPQPVVQEHSQPPLV